MDFNKVFFNDMTELEVIKLVGKRIWKRMKPLMKGQTGRYFNPENPSLVEYFFCHVKCEAEADKLLPDELRRLKCSLDKLNAKGRIDD